MHYIHSREIYAGSPEREVSRRNMGTSLGKRNHAADWHLSGQPGVVADGCSNHGAGVGGQDSDQLGLKVNLGRRGG